MVQLSHLYMTTGKTLALTIWTFVGKVMSLKSIKKMIAEHSCFFHLPAERVSLLLGKQRENSLKIQVLLSRVMSWVREEGRWFGRSVGFLIHHLKEAACTRLQLEVARGEQMAGPPCLSPPEPHRLIPDFSLLTLNERRHKSAFLVLLS